MARMRFSNRTILIAFVVLTLLLFPAVAFTSGALRIVLALPVALFIPGYTLLAAIFPKKSSLGGVERVVFSLGLSMAISLLVGVVLNFNPWGISTYPVLISVTLFVVITALVAWFRTPPPGEELSVTIGIDLSGWGKMVGLDKALSIFLVVAILITLGSIGYVIAVPKQEQPFTEFYILASDGRAENYPEQVVLGEPVELIIGVANHEGVGMSYLVSISINGVESEEIETALLADGESWEQPVSLVPKSSGVEQRIEFWLYKNGEAEPYLEEPLYLYIDVTEPS